MISTSGAVLGRPHLQRLPAPPRVLTATWCWPAGAPPHLFNCSAVAVAVSWFSHFSLRNRTLGNISDDVLGPHPWLWSILPWKLRVLLCLQVPLASWAGPPPRLCGHGRTYIRDHDPAVFGFSTWMYFMGLFSLVRLAPFVSR